MTTRERRWLLFWLAIGIGALLLLAASLPQLAFRPGRLFALGQGPSLGFGTDRVAPAGVADLTLLRMVLAGISLALIAVLVVQLFLSAQLRWELLRRILMVLAIFLLFNLALSVLRGVSDQGALPEFGAPPQPAQGGAEPLPAFAAQPPSWLIVAVSLLLAILLVGGIWLFRRRAPPRENPLVAAAQQALADLQAGGELQGTVLRCYLQMSQVLSEERGVERQSAMTPREFERYLAAAGLSDQHIQQLTRMFERVRYGPAQPSAQDEQEAMSCLTAIVRAYGSKP